MAEETFKVGDKVRARGWTKDNLGVGTVVRVVKEDGHYAGAPPTLTIKWQTKNEPGGGWKFRDVVKTGGN